MAGIVIITSAYFVRKISSNPLLAFIAIFLIMIYYLFSRQHTFSNQLKEKDIKISDLNSLLNHQKRLLSEKEETIRVIKKEKDDLQTWYIKYFNNTLLI